jgi:hypothetical protein
LESEPAGEDIAVAINFYFIESKGRCRKTSAEFIADQYPNAPYTSLKVIQSATKKITPAIIHLIMTLFRTFRYTIKIIPLSIAKYSSQDHNSNRYAAGLNRHHAFNLLTYNKIPPMIPAFRNLCVQPSAHFKIIDRNPMRHASDLMKTPRLHHRLPAAYPPPTRRIPAVYPRPTRRLPAGLSGFPDSIDE